LSRRSADVENGTENVEEPAHLGADALKIRTVALKKWDKALKESALFQRRPTGAAQPSSLGYGLQNRRQTADLTPPGVEKTIPNLQRPRQGASAA